MKAAAAIGGESYVKLFVADKVNGWSEEVTVQFRFAESQPHAACCAFMYSLSCFLLGLSLLCVMLTSLLRCSSCSNWCPPPNDSSWLLFAHWGSGYFWPFK